MTVIHLAKGRAGCSLQVLRSEVWALVPMLLNSIENAPAYSDLLGGGVKKGKTPQPLIPKEANPTAEKRLKQMVID